MSTAAVAHALSSSTVRRVLSVNPVATEISLLCSDGIKLSGQAWSTADDANNNNEAGGNKRRILCLHGWLDNCRSFHIMAPSLIQKIPDCELIALDFVGHGLSGHKSDDATPAVLAELAFYVAEAVEQLKWNDESAPFTLIGHSMGAAVSSLYAAAFPEQVHKLILLDGLGPFSRNPSDIAKHVRQHVQRRQIGLQQPRREPRIYPSLEKAVEARLQTATNFPGNQYLSEAAAKEMVLRGSRPVHQRTQDDEAQKESNVGLQFRHDPRLLWPSIQYFTDDQVDGVYKDIQCPTALLLAVDGWPFEQDKYQRAIDILKPVVTKTLPGSHHFHADPDTAHAVVDEVVAFLDE